LFVYFHFSRFPLSHSHLFAYDIDTWLPPVCLLNRSGQGGVCSMCQLEICEYVDIWMFFAVPRELSNVSNGNNQSQGETSWQCSHIFANMKSKAITTGENYRDSSVYFLVMYRVFLLFWHPLKLHHVAYA